MSDIDPPQAILLLVMLVFVGSSLIGMRLPIGKVAKMGLAWVAIFGVGFALFAFRDDFSAMGQRLRAEATGRPVVEGGEVRIPVSEDGHFWVSAELNGQQTRFLVDSGASITTVSSATAQAAGLKPGMRVAMVETANGVVRMRRATADRFQLGPIERSDLSVNINERDSSNVLGMNFLSSLSGWGVQGNYLVLRP
ncbi:MAG: TIGR02281 family clan AA aspartic protease [Pseudomonadota bacterium]|nr:TIGR02281 family clan AA aspartic protease [Pseudomonadota bacterium]